MDNIFKTKEEYEIDPNSSFNKLKKLQITLKEEVALNDIYFENRDNLLKKIENNCYEYYKRRMSIQEIYDHGTQSLKGEAPTKKIIYVVSDKPQNELPQCFDPLYKLMFYFRESNELTLKLIEHCPQEKYEQIANFICNYFYVNIFSSTFLNENLLTLLYLLLEKEVEKIKSENQVKSFLDYPQSFIASALKCLSRRDEVKTYLEKILKRLLTRTSGMLRNQKNNKFIGLEINKLKEYFRNNNYHLDRTEKDISSIKNLLASNIYKSKLSLFEKNKFDNTINYNPKNKGNVNSNNNEKNELNENEVENNIWVQATKETFDDLLLGNDALDNDDEFYFKDDDDYIERTQKNDLNYDDLERYFINTGYFRKKIKKDSLGTERRSRYTISKSNYFKATSKTISDISNYATVNIINEDEEGIADANDINDDATDRNVSNMPPLTERFNEEEKHDAEEKEEKKKNDLKLKPKPSKKKIIEENNEKINYLYLKELNQETLLNLLDKQTNKDMEEYLLNQLKIIEKDGSCFTNQKLVSEIINSSKTEKSREKIALAYKYHFECIKQFIDEIFTELLKNIDNIPYIIRAVCTIISKLIKIKFPNITTIQIIPFISKFIFTNLIDRILVNPKFNGIMMFDFSKDKVIHNERNNKIFSMNKILAQLLKGQLYNSSIMSGNEYNYTLFNPYFIEIMPYVIDFFKNITSVKLPVNIEMLIEEKKMQKVNEINNDPSHGALRESLIKNLLPRSFKRLSTSTPANPYLPTDSKSKTSIEFNFLKSHPDERIEHQSLCLTWEDFLIIYNIIKSNELAVVGDPSGIVSKTYKKMTFHEETLKKKMEKDAKEGKKTYIYMTKLVMDDKLKEKINGSKDKKFSFQESENLSDTSKETFILKRVKYSINTIIKHLNILTRTNFYVDENESTENFVIGLNKMIKMEGFSEMLKEKTLPLEWFGLYLQSNIENIPIAYKKNNYSLLYAELLEESNGNLEKIKNDDSLNIIYNKIINSEKVIDISSNGLKRITNNEKKFEIFFFILKNPIPVVITIYYADDELIKKIELKIKEDSPVPQKKNLSLSVGLNLNIFKLGSKENEEEKKEDIIKKFECKNILDFCKYFPSLTSEVITDYFNYQEEIKLNSFLEDYFSIINDYIKKEPMFNEYKETEIKNIQIQIENFIHAQIYNKIFNTKPDATDTRIAKNCEKYNWIKPQNLSSELKYVDDKMVQIMIYFAKNMINEMCPGNKVNEFEKIDMIINNIIILYGFDPSLYNNLMIYVFIKAKPELLNSVWRYIKLYLDNNLMAQHSALLDKIGQLIKNLSFFNESLLVGDVKKDKNQKKN